MPALLPIVQAYPGGTSPTSSPNVWNYRALGRQVDNEDSGMVRLDYHYSDRTTAFVRFNSDEAVETTPTGQLIAKTLWETKFNNGVFELLHVFSPRLVKRIQVWNRPGFLSQRDGIASAVYLQRFRFQLFVGRTRSDNPSKTISFLDDISWSKGNHTLKFGVEVKRGTAARGSLHVGRYLTIQRRRHYDYDRQLRNWPGNPARAATLGQGRVLAVPYGTGAAGTLWSAGEPARSDTEPPANGRCGRTARKCRKAAAQPAAPAASGPDAGEEPRRAACGVLLAQQNRARPRPAPRGAGIEIFR